jgi:hypothetical protein
MVPNTAVRYSLSFKHQVINELESGRFRSINEARQHYGISGGGQDDFLLASQVW